MGEKSPTELLKDALEPLLIERKEKLIVLLGRAKVLHEEFSRFGAGYNLEYEPTLYTAYVGLLADARELGLGEFASLDKELIGNSGTASTNLRLLAREIKDVVGSEEEKLVKAKKRITELENEIKVLTSSSRMPRPENPYTSPKEITSSFPELAQPYVVEAELCYNFGFYKAAAAMIGNAFEAMLTSYFEKKGWQTTKSVDGRKKQMSYRDKAEQIKKNMDSETEKSILGQLIEFHGYLRTRSNHPSTEIVTKNRILASIQNIIEINTWMNKN